MTGVNNKRPQISLSSIRISVNISGCIYIIIITITRVPAARGGRSGVFVYRKRDLGVRRVIGASCLAIIRNTVVKKLAVNNVPRSGPPAQLLEMFGISSNSIVQACNDIIKL